MCANTMAASGPRRWNVTDAATGATVAADGERVSVITLVMVILGLGETQFLIVLSVSHSEAHSFGWHVDLSYAVRISLFSCVILNR